MKFPNKVKGDTRQDITSEAGSAVEVNSASGVGLGTDNVDDVEALVEVENLDAVSASTETDVGSKSTILSRIFGAGKKNILTSVDEIQKLIPATDVRSSVSADLVGDMSKQLMQSLSGDKTKSKKHIVSNNVVGLYGVKGGVGVSTLVANIAHTIEKLGYTVCVVDTSILAPTQPYIWGDKTVLNAPSLLTLIGSDDVASVVTKIANTNISLVFCNNNSIVDATSSDRGSVMNTALRWLADMFDVVLVDIANELTCLSVAAKLECHNLIPVWAASTHALVNVNKDIRNSRLTALRLEKASRVIVNQVVGLCADYRGIAKHFHYNVLAEVPWCLEYHNASCSARLFARTSSTDEATMTVFNALSAIATSIINN